MTFWYQIELGIPPFENVHEGIPLQYRIHNPQEFEEIHIKNLVGADKPSWMMIESEARHREELSLKMSQLQPGDEEQRKRIQDLIDVLDEYNSRIVNGAEKAVMPRNHSQSFQQYVQEGPSNDFYLDDWNFSKLTRLGGKYTKKAAVPIVKSRARRLSIATATRHFKNGIQNIKEMSGHLQSRLNHFVQGTNNTTINTDIQQTKANANWFEMLTFLLHFVYHVVIGGLFDGVSSMLQVWAVLIFVSSFIRSIQIPNVEVINTAIMSVASVGYFLSFMFFYRVNAKFGPFIVILKEMTVEDLSKWLFLVVLFLAGTGQAMFIILDDPMSFLKPFKWMLGDTEQHSPDSPIEDLMYSACFFAMHT